MKEGIDIVDVVQKSRVALERRGGAGEKFARFYVGGLSAHKEGVSGGQWRLFMILVGVLEWNLNRVVMTNKRRGELMGMCGIKSQSTFYRTLEGLLDSELLLPGSGRGEYVANPLVVWMGDDMSRDTVLGHYENVGYMVVDGRFRNVADYKEIEKG